MTTPKPMTVAEAGRKLVEWAYPTSDNARKFGFAKTGCWTVETQIGIEPPKALAGYVDRQSALKHAVSLQAEWHPAWLRFNKPPEATMSDSPKNPNAVALGRLGGKAGTGASKARFKGTERARERARHAARARWANRIREQDITVTKLFPSGYLEISYVMDGQLIRRRYGGTPRREAIREFLRDMNRTSYDT